MTFIQSIFATLFSPRVVRKVIIAMVAAILAFLGSQALLPETMSPALQAGISTGIAFGIREIFLDFL